MSVCCAAVCITVTLLDGLVLARSQFNTDMVRAPDSLRFVTLGSPAILTHLCLHKQPWRSPTSHASLGLHAQNYRCVLILGTARSISDPVEKAAALLKITEHIIPGRTQHARAASDRELSQTAVLAIDLEEVSAKVCACREVQFSPSAGSYGDDMLHALSRRWLSMR